MYKLTLYDNTFRGNVLSKLIRSWNDHLGMIAIESDVFYQPFQKGSRYGTDYV